MAACQIQHGVQVFFRIIFHLLHVQRVDMARVSPAQQKVKHQSAQHIIHHAVQLAAAQISPLFTVTDLVGRIFPNFTDQGRFRITLFQFAVKGRQEFIRQLIRHVQAPAADTGLQPVFQHAVLIPYDKILIAAVCFINFRQALITPPAAVLFRKFLELIPGIIRRLF